jgi:hypothetical protein
MYAFLSIMALTALTACGDGTNLPTAIVVPVQPAAVVSAQADVAVKE